MDEFATTFFLSHLLDCVPLVRLIKQHRGTVSKVVGSGRALEIILDSIANVDQAVSQMFQVCPSSQSFVAYLPQYEITIRILDVRWQD